MAPLEFVGGLPGTDHSDAWWEAVHALYDEAFPGLPAGIRAARAVGADWRRVSTPFAFFENGRCVAHVGLINHPMLLAGAPHRVAGIHAVCTTAPHRRRGLCRALLARALAHADEHPAPGAAPGAALAKLHTDDPPVYTGSGFAVRPTWRFRSALAPETVPWRALRPLDDPDDRACLDRLLAARRPVSAVCSSTDSGWMVTIDAALSGRLAGGFRYLPDHDALVCGQRLPSGEVLVIACIAAVLPPAPAVLGALSDLGERFLWSFSPDLLEPTALPVAAPPHIGHFMVRGDWPVQGPFGISPLWEH